MLLGQDKNPDMIHTYYILRAHDNVPDDVTEAEDMVPESNTQTISDDNANLRDSISEAHVNLPENTSKYARKRGYCCISFTFK